MGDDVEVGEGDKGMGLVAAFHGDNDGQRAAAQIGQLLAGEFVLENSLNESDLLV